MRRATGPRLAAAGFLAWGAAFIGKSSFIASDGHRYFCLFDDAMVSMRYAWNLAHGTGLVWNPGERVEGYTSLLMTLLMSMAAALFGKLTAVLVVQILGCVTVLAVAGAGAALARLLFDAPQARVAAPLSFFAILLYYPLAYWSLMGMETGLLALLVTGGLAAALRFSKEHRSRMLAACAGLLGLAFLARPDAALLAIPVFVFLALDARRSRPQLGSVAMALGSYLLVVAGHTLFRLAYYGEAVPNTYFLKLVGIPLAGRLRDGAAFIGPFLASHAPLIGLATLARPSVSRGKALVVSVLVLTVGYQVWIGGDPWPYWRFLTPAIPGVIVLCSGVVASVAGSRPSRWAVPQGTAGLVLALLIADHRFLGEALLLKPAFQVEENRSNVNTAVAIQALTTPSASVGGCWAGAIPYYTGRVAVDFLGKSDRYIARRPPDLSGRVGWAGLGSVPGHNKYDLDYSIKQLQPTWVERFAWGGQDVSTWAETHYRKVQYRGMLLYFLAGSPEVLWSQAESSM